jgi:hypothetical protein
MPSTVDWLIMHMLGGPPNPMHYEQYASLDSSHGVTLVTCIQNGNISCHISPKCNGTGSKLRVNDYQAGVFIPELVLHGKFHEKIWKTSKICTLKLVIMHNGPVMLNLMHYAL